MDVTLLGITVFLQPVTNSFVDVLMIALQFSRESYTVLPLSTLIDVKPLQLWKAELLMVVTLLGMVTDVKPLQTEKAELPMDVPLLGITVFMQPAINPFVDVLMMALQFSRES